MRRLELSGVIPHDNRLHASCRTMPSPSGQLGRCGLSVNAVSPSIPTTTSISAVPRLCSGSSGSMHPVRFSIPAFGASNRFAAESASFPRLCRSARPFPGRRRCSMLERSRCTPVSASASTPADSLPFLSSLRLGLRPPPAHRHLVASLWPCRTPSGEVDPDHRTGWLDQDTVIAMRQWSLGPHSSGPFRAATCTDSIMFLEANTKSSCRVAVAGFCRLWW